MGTFRFVLHQQLKLCASICHYKKNSGAQSSSELYRPSDRRLSAKLMPTLADRGCRAVSATNPHGREIRFYRPDPRLSIQLAPHINTRRWVDPVLDPLLLRKSGSAGNQTQDLWICSQEVWPLDHRGGPICHYTKHKSTPYYSKHPRLYGLTNIHKADIPLRPIMSSIGSPCYALAGFLHKILTPLDVKEESFVNSGHFVQLLKYVNLVRFDVVSFSLPHSWRSPTSHQK
jgi:hypothetical protein